MASNSFDPRRLPAASVDAEAAGRVPVVPDHELVRRIGRGSYGEVWLARSVLGQWRAVKVVHRENFRDARPYEREFHGILHIEPLSRSHDGLVDILHVGRHEPEGYFYYVMELADDAAEGAATEKDFARRMTRYQPLTLARELKRRGRLPFEECVALGVGLSSALSHIHQHGLIHRDVKPSNILYVGGTPKLGDIGLVGEAGESASFVGTEGYIPPEGPGSAQADVFSLGKVLYEASTGQDRLEFPLLPTELGEEQTQRQLAELNEVFLKACAPEPRNRYQSAADLHADLSLLHRGQSVRRQRRVERRWRWAVLAGYGGAALLGLGAGVLWSPIQRPAATANASAPGGSAPLPKQAAVDLTKFCNVTLSSNWTGDFAENNLSSLPTGWRRFGPAHFDPRGLIQLGGGYLENRRLFYPDAVEGIAVNRKCRRLHFLHGTVWGVEHGRHAGSYVLHFADGRSEEIPLRYGDELRNWWWSPKASLEVVHGTVAWLGTNAATHDQERICLYAITWNNPHPETAVTSLDFVSTKSPSCPFLLAITVE
ncbi:MAG: serine/threonine protein kinase [Verrucomicrobia bacterium]|nr:serine/threonine protein kinase [Verrucomicrobiota bacterium]